MVSAVFSQTAETSGTVLMTASAPVIDSTPLLKRPLTLYEDAAILIVDKPAGWICSDEVALKTFGKGIFLVHRLFVLSWRFRIRCGCGVGE